MSYGVWSWPAIALINNPAYAACATSSFTASYCNPPPSPLEAVAAHPYGAYALVILALGLSLIGWSLVQRVRTDQEWSLGRRHWAILVLGGLLVLWMALTIQGIGYVGSAINRSGSEITVSDPYFLQSAFTGIILGVVSVGMMLVGAIGTIENIFPREN